MPHLKAGNSLTMHFQNRFDPTHSLKALHKELIETALHAELALCPVGAKADPSRVKIADLSEASSDPLARKVRHLLRLRHGVSDGVRVVLSAEKPRCALISVDDLTHEPHELQASLAKLKAREGKLADALIKSEGLTVSQSESIKRLSPRPI